MNVIAIAIGSLESLAVEMRDSLHNAVGRLQVETLGGANSNPALIGSGLFSGRNFRLNEITGLKALNLLTAHQVTPGETVLG